MIGTLSLTENGWVINYKTETLPLHPMDTPPEVIENGLHTFDGVEIDFEKRTIDVEEKSKKKETIYKKIDVAKIIYTDPFINGPIG